MTKWKAWRAVAELVLVLLLWFAPACAEPIAVGAQPVHFNPDDPSQLRAGALQWVAGLSLTSPDPRFGGWSGMVLSPDGRQLTAVSDVGFWLTGTLQHDAQGRVTGVAAAQLGPLLDTEGTPLKSKRFADAELLARDRDGSLLVGFEGVHRIWRYRPGADLLAARAEPVPTPRLLQRAPRNGGLEALTVLADGRLVMFTEELTNADGNLVGWVREGQAWRELALVPAGQFKPTDLTQLPDGDLLLLERRFTLLGGIAMRLRRIAAGEVKAGARIEGKELVELTPPVSVDNMECVAAVRTPAGGTLIYIMSDDNFSPVQRTLLLQFRLLE